MRTEVRNQISMLGHDVCAEVPRRRPTHRRWLRLGPWESGLRLWEVEVPATIDPTDWPRTPEDDPVVVSREDFTTLAAALEALVARGVDTDTFDALWKTDNPF